MTNLHRLVWPVVLLTVGLAARYAASPHLEGACVVRGAGGALDGVFAPVLRAGAAQPLIKSAGAGGATGAAWVRIGPALSRLPDALTLLGGRVVAAIPALEIAREMRLREAIAMMEETPKGRIDAERLREQDAALQEIEKSRRAKDRWQYGGWAALRATKNSKAARGALLAAAAVAGDGVGARDEVSQ